MSEQLISADYQAQLKQKHADSPGWGTSGRNFAPTVQRLVMDTKPINILDYGCGKGTLARALPQYPIRGYDPGIPGCETPPEPHELVICTDVLEHIEPECLDAVLDDLQRVTRKYLFVLICTVPAEHDLPDGRNAHLIVEPIRWWMNKLWDRFELCNCAVGDVSFQAVWKAVPKKGNGKS